MGGIIVSQKETETFIYICGISPIRSIKFDENIDLLPVESEPVPDDMIDCVMKNGSKSEFELGVLISTLRKTTAVLRIRNIIPKTLACMAWNAQWICVYIGALLKCEVSWYFQANKSADEFNAFTKVNMIYPNMHKFPDELKVINQEECDYLEQSMPKVLNLCKDYKLSTAMNALWSYKWNPNAAVQFSIVWGGIESLFLIERKIKVRLATAASRFLLGNDDMIEKIKKLYEARCKAVHELKSNGEALLDESVNLLHSLILRCVEVNDLPDVKVLLKEIKSS